MWLGKLAKAKMKRLEIRAVFNLATDFTCPGGQYERVPDDLQERGILHVVGASSNQQTVRMHVHHGPLGQLLQSHHIWLLHTQAIPAMDTRRSELPMQLVRNTVHFDALELFLKSLGNVLVNCLDPSAMSAPLSSAIRV